VALRPADDVVVNNTFIKILRPPKSPEPGQPFQSTIAYREYAYIAGDFGIALAVNTDEQANAIKHWFAHINYLGKRGSFIQLQYMPNVVDELTSENGWVIVGQFPTEGLPLDAVFTQLDDTTEQATFERVNIYSAGKIELGKHRVLHPVALPYVRVKSSRGYTHYRRRDDP
jgi:acyl-homoserine lactone acylase PvdQ